MLEKMDKKGESKTSLTERIFMKYFKLRYSAELLILRIMFRIRHTELSPKGECVYRYYQRVIDGSLLEKDQIEEYELPLKKAIEDSEERGEKTTREEIARGICEILEQMKRPYAEKQVA